MKELKILNDMEADMVQNTLIQNNFSITETSRLLGIDAPTLYGKIAKYGLKTYDGELKPYIEDPKADLSKAIGLIENLVALCIHAGDFSNGNIHNGVDEGRVMASNIIYEIERKAKELRDRNNL